MPQLRRTDRLERVAPLAEEQHRVVRLSQLYALGWAHHHVVHEIEFGRWTQVAPEVIALQNAELVWEQRLWLGVLHAGPGAALTHRTACQVAGLKRWESDTIHVLSPKSHTVEKLDGFFFHETRRDYRGWIHPASAPPQLVLDKAAALAAERERSLRAGIGLLAACVQQRLSTAERLVQSTREISRLRHGKLFRLALGDIAGGSQSMAEIDIVWLCRQFGLAPPTRQQVRRDKTGRRRYLDCVWELPDGRVIVLEIDGSFHAETEQWWQDMKRERDIALSHKLVLRCSAIEIRLEPKQILQDLGRAGVPRIASRAA